MNIKWKWPIPAVFVALFLVLFVQRIPPLLGQQVIPPLPPRFVRSRIVPFPNDSGLIARFVVQTGLGRNDDLTITIEGRDGVITKWSGGLSQLCDADVVLVGGQPWILIATVGTDRGSLILLRFDGRNLEEGGWNWQGTSFSHEQLETGESRLYIGPMDESEGLPQVFTFAGDKFASPDRQQEDLLILKSMLQKIVAKTKNQVDDAPLNDRFAPIEMLHACSRVFAADSILGNHKEASDICASARRRIAAWSDCVTADVGCKPGRGRMLLELFDSNLKRIYSGLLR